MECAQRLFRPLRHHANAAIALIPHNTGQIERPGALAHKPPETNALHRSMNMETAHQRDNAHVAFMLRIHRLRGHAQECEKCRGQHSGITQIGRRQWQVHLTCPNALRQ